MQLLVHIKFLIFKFYSRGSLPVRNRNIKQKYQTLSFEAELVGLQVGEVALSILHSMVAVHSDLDDAGELIIPTPRVKRILTSPRCLNHIAQVRFLHLISCFLVLMVSCFKER